MRGSTVGLALGLRKGQAQHMKLKMGLTVIVNYFFFGKPKPKTVFHSFN